jgi:Zn-dependent protease
VGDGISIGRFLGIPVRVHPSVLLIAALITWSLAAEELPTLAEGSAVAAYWGTAVVVAVLFLASLMAHEGAHAVVAQRHGVTVERVTLWVFGGVAWLGGEAPDPRADLRIAAAGPLTSIALSFFFGATAAALDVAGAPGLLVASAGWLATINVVLEVFNLVPGAPLDGGRVLRALLWRRWGDRDRAAITAARSGRIVGLVLVALGGLEVLIGLVVSGLWLVLIGVFIRSAASREMEDAVVRRGLRGATVADALAARAAPAPVVDIGAGRVDVTLSDSLVQVRDRMASANASVANVVDRGVPVAQLRTADVLRLAGPRRVTTRRSSRPRDYPPPPPPPPWHGILSGRR